MSVLIPASAIASEDPPPDAAAKASSQPAAADFWTNRGHWTFGTQLGFAFENHVGRDYSHMALVIAQPNVGFIVKNFDTRSFVSRFSLVSEGILGGAIHPGGHMLGQALLLRLDGKPTHRAVPFFDCGAGVLYTTINEHAKELTGHTQFNPQGGFGIQYFFNPQRAFVVEYRYMHMSNNSIQLPNFGFNSNMITIGFRWLRRPQRTVTSDK